MKQGTFYLTEEKHTDFKIKCLKEGVSMTSKIEELIEEYILTPAPIKKEAEQNLETNF